MFAKKILKASIAAAVFSSSVAYAEVEVTGKITHESASFHGNGTLIGNNNSISSYSSALGAYAVSNATHDENLKSATSARIYVDGPLDELKDGATFHIELQAFRDSSTVDGLDGNEAYSQRDALREAYVDTDYGDWLIRAGKQQAVWGTADGIKLLDAINPTDYTELVQNSPEDSRIPVWMINADRATEDGGNFQAIISQPKANFIPGMSNNSSTVARVHTNGDKGAPFIMKGVDTITGRVNGFLNIAPDIGATAQTFNSGFGSLAGFNAATVGEFMNGEVPGFAAACGGDGANCSAAVLSHFARASSTTTNVIKYDDIDSTKTDYSTYGANANEGGTNPGSAFAYMTDATFATFNSFSGAKSRYVVDHDTDTPNINLRYKNTTDDGLNYSFNFMHHYDTNPYVYVQWEDATTGAKLTQTTSEAVEGDGNNTNGNGDQDGRKYRTISLQGAYGYIEGVSDGKALSVNPATLAFHEELNKINSIGGSFDTTVDSQEFGPVVIRGEVLYNQDEMMPVIDRNKLAHGDLPGALTMQKSDTLKYVLGADITVDTNMLVSGQFIQMINLDYVDRKTDYEGAACGSKVNCGVYSADMAAMHLSNGLQKAEEMKEFYSLYLSKPFGESGQHRWNNIYMFEENDGNWNRFDVEYTIDDNTQLTAEVNSYWGDVNTQFGQMKDSSNVQVGVKYTF
jgi:hypothetical protein